MDSVAPFAQRYRLFIDESGDHAFQKLDSEAHRYLCLIGCWFENAAYRSFDATWRALKQKFFSVDPDDLDDLVVIHREDVINRRDRFCVLKDPQIQRAFDDELIALIDATGFRTVAIVIDKLGLQNQYVTPEHPYHLALRFMLERYCRFLERNGKCGDVMAEARGRTEDQKLQQAYHVVRSFGTRFIKPPCFLRTLTSKEIKIRPKAQNISGLQLADVLANPVRSYVLHTFRRRARPNSHFWENLIRCMARKFNSNDFTGVVQGYGYVMFPK